MYINNLLEINYKNYNDYSFSSCLELVIILFKISSYKIAYGLVQSPVDDIPLNNRDTYRKVFEYNDVELHYVPQREQGTSQNLRHEESGTKERAYLGSRLVPTWPVPYTPLKACVIPLYRDTQSDGVLFKGIRTLSLSCLLYFTFF